MITNIDSINDAFSRRPIDESQTTQTQSSSVTAQSPVLTYEELPHICMPVDIVGRINTIVQNESSNGNTNLKILKTNFEESKNEFRN